MPRAPSRAPTAKRPRSGAASAKPSAPPRTRTRRDLAEDVVLGGGEDTSEGEEEEEGAPPPAEATETVDATRLRLAKEYLGRLTAVDTHEGVSDRLRDDGLALRGRLIRRVADLLTESAWPPASRCVQFVKGHNAPVTCVAVSSNGGFAVTGSKDCTLVRWNLALPAAGASASSPPALVSSKMAYPGRHRTKADVEAQAAGGKLRMVVAAGDGGGRIGSTTGLPAAVAAALRAPKISRTSDGVASIVVPAREGGGGKRGGEGRSSMHSLPDFGIAGHFDDVLAVALSSDGTQLVSGGRDKLVRVWDPTTPVNVDNFVGHKDGVTCLSFRHGTHTLYSGSEDRSVKQWSLDELAYVDTLFGHQSPLTGLDAGRSGRERAVSVGGDRTARLWKVPEQSQLVFRAHAGDVSTESVAFVEDSWFVTGAQNGTLSVWTTALKKPVATHNAHGDGHTLPRGVGEPEAEVVEEAPPPPSEDAAAAEERAEAARLARLTTLGAVVGATPEKMSGGFCNWVCALAHLPNSDLLASGSGDGFLRFWKMCEDGKARGGGPPGFSSLVEVASLRVPGIINGLAFSYDGSVLVAAVGQEHRLGRWWRYGKAKNGLLVVALPPGLKRVDVGRGEGGGDASE